MQSPPSNTALWPLSDSVSWHSIAIILLGPPQEVDFQKEAARRQERRGFVSKIIPNDDQCRYLWRFHSSTNDEQQVTANEHKKAVNDLSGKNRQDFNLSARIPDETSDKSINGKGTLCREAVERKPPSATLETLQSSPSLDRNRKFSVNLNGSKGEAPPSKRQRFLNSSDDGGGWISRSKFYDESKPSRTKLISRHSVGELYEKKGSFGTEDPLGRGQLQLPREQQKNTSFGNILDIDMKCSVGKSDADVKRVAFPGGGSPIESGSPEENVDGSRRKRRLFLPSARRANLRFKQTSIKDLFGGR